MTTLRRHRGRHSTRTPNQPGLTRYSCYAHIRAAGAAIRSHLRESEAWNFNRRSWTHDSEVTAAVYHDAYSREPRLDLAREHLDREGPLDDLHDTNHPFTAFADCATPQQAWYDCGRQGTRPRGRLRPIQDAPEATLTRAWATALYRLVYDPDGRPVKLKMRRSF